MELKENNIYIFTQKNTNYPSPFKGKILELTKTTIYLENLDINTKWRKTLECFNNDLKPIELVYDFNKSIEDAIKEMNKQPLEFKKFEENPFIKKIDINTGKCFGPCFCDGSCFKINSTIINYEKSNNR